MTSHSNARLSPILINIIWIERRRKSEFTIKTTTTVCDMINFNFY